MVALGYRAARLMLEKIPKVTLNDGMKLPSIGFSTFKLNGSEGVEAIKRAVNGYRRLNSACNSTTSRLPRVRSYKTIQPISWRAAA